MTRYDKLLSNCRSNYEEYGEEQLQAETARPIRRDVYLLSFSELNKKDSLLMPIFDIW